jgi:hypothetical protein
MGKWLCIDGFVFMDVGIWVLFYECLGNSERCSLQWVMNLLFHFVVHLNPMN